MMVIDNHFAKLHACVVEMIREVPNEDSGDAFVSFNLNGETFQSAVKISKDHFLVFEETAKLQQSIPCYGKISKYIFAFPKKIKDLDGCILVPDETKSKATFTSPSQVIRDVTRLANRRIKIDWDFAFADEVPKNLFVECLHTKLKFGAKTGDNTIFSNVQMVTRDDAKLGQMCVSKFDMGGDGIQISAPHTSGSVIVHINTYHSVVLQVHHQEKNTNAFYVVIPIY